MVFKLLFLVLFSSNKYKNYWCWRWCRSWRGSRSSI